MITRSMKRLVLSILETSREVTDIWSKNSKRTSYKTRDDFLQAMTRLEKAVERLDRIQNATEKTK